MLTVPQAARRTGRNPETIRRWIRAGRLRSTKVGTQHLIDEAELDEITGDEAEALPLPEDWPTVTMTGEPMPDPALIVRIIREHRGPI